MADTDGGQTVNPVWEEELSNYINFLYEHGVHKEGIRHMTQEIPAKLLDVY